MEPRAFDLLCHLVVHRDRVVPKNELLDQVWGDRFVTEAALTTALAAARLAVGDTGGLGGLIRTVHRRGYQFVAPATVAGSSPAAGSGKAAGVDLAALGTPAGADRQVIRFCRAEDGTCIAYATVGTGPPLLKAANWMTHLDLEWTTPVWSHWLAGLARDRRLIRYDERGCGLSDWDVPGFTFEDWVDDLETVAYAVRTRPVSPAGRVAGRRGGHRLRSAPIPSGSAGWSWPGRTPGDGSCGPATTPSAGRRPSTWTWPGGWGHKDPSFLRVFASQFLPDGTGREWEEFSAFQQRTTSPANGSASWRSSPGSTCPPSPAGWTARP